MSIEPSSSSASSSSSSPLSYSAVVKMDIDRHPYDQRAAHALAGAREAQRLADAALVMRQAKRTRFGDSRQAEEEERMMMTARPTIALNDGVSSYSLEWPALTEDDGDVEAFSCLRLRSWTLNLCFDRPVEARMYDDEACAAEEASAALLAQRAALPGRTLWCFRSKKGEAGWWLRVQLPDGNLVHIRFEPAIEPAKPLARGVYGPQLAFAKRLLAFWNAQRAALAAGDGLFFADSRAVLWSRRREDDWFARECAGEEEFVRRVRAAQVSGEALPAWVLARIRKRCFG